MKKLACISAVVACLVMVGPSARPGWAADAQEPRQTGPWSLQDCIRAAMSNQADILTAQNNVTIARNRVTDALSDYFPQLSVQNNTFVAGNQAGVLTQTTTGTAFNVSQNVFDGGIREASNLSARYGVKQNQAGLTRTVQTVVYDVTKAYYEVLRARHLAEVAQKTVEYNEELLKQMQAQAEEGKSAKVDVLPVQAELANARVSLLTAQNSVRTAALTLQTAIGLAPRSSFDVQEVGAPPDPRIEALDTYVTTALKDRPDIAQSQASVGAARASLRSARIGLYPRPVVSGSYQREIQGGFTTESTQLTGQIVFDIFNGNANRAAYNEAKATRANAELEEKQLLKDIRAEVEEAYLNLTSAKERIAASTIGLESAQENYSNQKERLRLGSGTVLDVLNAEVQLTTAQSNDVEARYDYYIAIAQIDYSTGSTQ